MEAPEGARTQKPAQDRWEYEYIYTVHIIVELAEQLNFISRSVTLYIYPTRVSRLENLETMLCKFCTAVCQEALRQTDKLRQSGLPPEKQFRPIQHFPGHTWTELEDGCVMNCYMCKRFWNKASDDYKKDAETGGLYPPGNKFSTVTSFTIMIKLDRASSRDPYSHYEISLWLYHSQVAYKSYFVPHIHSGDCQLFMILPSSGLQALHIRSVVS